MAKFEEAGYCPCIWVPKRWNEDTDKRLIGLWSLIGDSIIYENYYQNPLAGTTSCDQIFSDDPIAYDVLSAIIKKNVNAYKILIRRKFTGGCNMQSVSDIQEILKTATNPELVACAGSNFVVVLADADYGMDVWVWNLQLVW